MRTFARRVVSKCRELVVPGAALVLVALSGCSAPRGAVADPSVPLACYGVQFRPPFDGGTWRIAGESKNDWHGEYIFVRDIEDGAEPSRTCTRFVVVHVERLRPERLAAMPPALDDKLQRLVDDVSKSTESTEGKTFRDISTDSSYGDVTGVRFARLVQAVEETNNPADPSVRLRMENRHTFLFLPNDPAVAMFVLCSERRPEAMQGAPLADLEKSVLATLRFQ